MKKVYRPAGNSIVLKRAPLESNLFYPHKYRLLQSGTASLAAAITACIQLKGVRTARPEIILPAYACPDLVSAALFAGAKPVLVDLEENSPHLASEQVMRNVTADTIAIVAVNFLGLPGNIHYLRDLCKKNGLYLIYDCAQWFPIDKDYSWPGDFNIISFGRGKPINLLHGGAVILDDHTVEKALPELSNIDPNAFNHLIQQIKVRLYNLALHPEIYRFVARLPGLNIGQTLYKPLESITAMSPYYRNLIKSNIEKFRSQINILQYLEKKLAGISHPLLINPVAKEMQGKVQYLLRYPILINDKKTRDRFLVQTRDHGTSILYREPLNRIAGLEAILARDIAYPNAKNFADHLVTLPCHEDVDNAVIDFIIGKLSSTLGDRQR